MALIGQHQPRAGRCPLTSRLTTAHHSVAAFDRKHADWCAAVTSPTDFMPEPIRFETLRNFLRSQRGTLTTT